MAVRQRKNGVWSVYYQKDNRRFEEYFGKGINGQMRAWNRNSELGLGRRKQVAGPTFAELAEVYVVNKPFSDNSRKQLLVQLKKIILPFFGNRHALRLRDVDLDSYVAKRRKDGVKYSSIDRELTDVKAILNWSVRRRPPLIAVNPVATYQKPGEIDREEIRPPTPKEAEKIIKHASPHVARAIKLSWFLGLRPGSVELFSLTWDMVSWDTLTVAVQAAAKGKTNTRRSVKRIVPIHPDFVKELNAWHEKDGRPEKGPIVHYHSRAIKSMKKAWHNTLKSAGIKRRIRPYDMRHYFVTRALESGADIKAVAKVVGSSPETIRKHYQHVSLALHRQTVETIPALTTPVPEKIPRRKKKKPRKRAAQKGGSS